MEQERWCRVGWRERNLVKFAPLFLSELSPFFVLFVVAVVVVASVVVVCCCCTLLLLFPLMFVHVCLMFAFMIDFVD